VAVATFREDFETPDRGWFFAGQAGFDVGRNLAHTGANNAWVRATNGWHAINKFHPVFPHTACTASAWLRLSGSLTDGYFSVRGAAELNGNGPILTEIKLVGPGRANPDHRGYNRYNLTFNSGDLSRILVYVGLWGVGQDAWVQVDDVEITSRGNLEDDVVLNPV
jgi:hypothetical protein